MQQFSPRSSHPNRPSPRADTLTPPSPVPPLHPHSSTSRRPDLILFPNSIGGAPSALATSPAGRPSRLPPRPPSRPAPRPRTLRGSVGPSPPGAAPVPSSTVDAAPLAAAALLGRRRRRRSASRLQGEPVRAPCLPRPSGGNASRLQARSTAPSLLARRGRARAPTWRPPCGRALARPPPPGAPPGCLRALPLSLTSTPAAAGRALPPPPPPAAGAAPSPRLRGAVAPSAPSLTPGAAAAPSLHLHTRRPAPRPRLASVGAVPPCMDSKNKEGARTC